MKKLLATLKSALWPTLPPATLRALAMIRQAVPSRYGLLPRFTSTGVLTGLLCTGALPAQSPTPALPGSLQQQIINCEYHIRPGADGCLHSPNRAQNLRFHYAADGFTMEPRQSVPEGDSWQIQMQLRGVYRGADFCFGPDAHAAAAEQGSELRYHHAGGLIIEYLNGIQGMRQNFILTDKPLGEGPLSVRIDLNTHLTPSLNGARELVFTDADASRPRVHYRDFVVYDARGCTLPARMELDGNTLVLLANDADAVYPLTLDPLSASPVTVMEANQAYAYFGYAVSSGDLNGDGYAEAIVGAYSFDNGQNNEGAVFIFPGSAAGLSASWSQMLESNQADAYLGGSLAWVGDINADNYGDLVVGAPRYDNGELDEGAVFVYTGSAAGVSATPAWIFEKNQAGAKMGLNVAAAGDVNGNGVADFIVGAPYYDNGQTDEGVTWVYYGSAAGPSQVGGLQESNLADAHFGNALGGAGDINGDGRSDIVVGIPTYENGQMGEGAFFVYYGNAIGINNSPSLIIESNLTFQFLGSQVTPAGDVNGDGYADVAVQSLATLGPEINEGWVQVYLGSGTGLTTTPSVQIEGNQAEASMGNAIAFGDINADGYADISIGTEGYDQVFSSTGKVQVHLGAATGISSSPAHVYQGTVANETMGGSLSMGDFNGDGYCDLLSGAPGAENGQTEEGMVYAYYGGASGVFIGSGVQIERNLIGETVGTDVANAGDVNGDGYGDVLISASGYSASTGAVWVYHGTATGMAGSPAILLTGSQAGAIFGTSIASAGDVNGDGYADIVVGNPRHDNGQTDEGQVIVYRGSASGITAASPWITEANVATWQLGARVSSAGDINADGYADIMSSTNTYTNGQTNEGGVFISYGSASGIAAAPNLTLEVNVANASFGSGIAAGDINGDGYSDVLAGCRFCANGQANEGAVFVYLGTSTGLNPSFSQRIEPNLANAEMGLDVAVTDVNGDGYDDLIAGAPGYSNGQLAEGALYVFYGSVSGLSSTPATLFQSNLAGARLGWTMNRAGDVNGDGYEDVLSGAYTYSNPESYEGAVYLLKGSSTGLQTSGYDLWEPNLAGAQLGWSACGAGDVNGDGFSDILLGANRYTNGQTDEGSAYMRYGGTESTLDNKTRLTRLYRSDLTTPVTSGGSSFSSGNQFGLGHYARSFYGRTRVKLVWEIRAQGVPFSGNPITNSTVSTGESATWTDIGTAGLELKQLLTAVSFQNKVRVRVKYQTAGMLNGQQYSRWYYLGIHDRSQMSLVPVELTAWEGHAEGQQVRLDWITASEQESDRFIVERSTDAQAFTEIGTVAAAGNSVQEQAYSLYDPQPAPVNYYRLRTLSRNGEEDLSEVIRVEFTGAAAVQIWPQPASGNLHLSAAGLQAARLYDMQGRSVRSQTLSGDAATLDISGLAAGMYLLEVRTGNGSSTHRIHLE